MAFVPQEVVTSIDEIEAALPGIQPTQVSKVIDHIDPLCQAWIERSPYLVMTTVDGEGRLDVSPKGDPAGFVKVLGAHTLAVPDRPGNHRFDSFRNILATGRIGLMFLVPGRTEVVRVNGSAQIVRDLQLRETMAIKGRVPDFALLVTVEEAFYHCGKAAIRSGLWKSVVPDLAEGLPTYGEALLAHSQVDQSLAEIDARLKFNDEKRLYDE